MKYIVKFEHRPEWGNFCDLHDDSQWIVTKQEIADFAVAWDVPISELMKQVDEMTTQVKINGE